MKEQVIIANTIIGVVDTESDTTTGAMTSVQYAPVYKFEKPYPIEVEDAKLIRCSTTKEGMELFHTFLSTQFKEGSKLLLFCHNLKWDITFFLNWLMKDKGFKHRELVSTINKSVKRSKKLNDNEFDTLITNMGQVFCIRYRYKGLDITIQDSLKIIPFSLREACKKKNYDTKFKKISDGVDYDAELSDEYCLHDVLCLSELVSIQINEGFNPTNTVSLAAWCLRDYKEKFFNDSPLGKKYRKLKEDNKKAQNPSKCYRYYFPRLDDKYDFAKDTSDFGVKSMDAYARQSYRGGLTYCNPRNANTIFISKWFYDKYKDTPQLKEVLEKGNCKIVNYLSHLDVNSLYPSKCLKGYKTFNTLPVGKPRLVKGGMEVRLIEDTKANKKHFIVRFSCKFNIKPNKFPTVQIKGSYFNPNEWLTSNKIQIGDTVFDYPVHITLTDIEFFDFLERYDIEDLKIQDHMIFDKVEKCEDLFDCYMGYYYNLKANTNKSEHFVQYQSYKLKLNGLTGKFGSSVIASIKQPYIDDKGAIQLKTIETDDSGFLLTKQSEYTPIISFITAMGRLTLVQEMDNAGLDGYITGDTDSLFTATEERFIPSLGISHTEINKFDEEDGPEDMVMFCASRQKTYIMMTKDGTITLKVAGMTEEQKKKFIATSKSPFLDFSQDKLEVEGGKLLKMSTPDGAVLVDTDFKLTEKHSKPSVKKVIKAMSGEEVYSEVNLKERLAYDEDFKIACINAYNYLAEKNQFTRKAFGELLGFTFDVPFEFIGYVKTLIFR